jgi:hypothetical protein
VALRRQNRPQSAAEFRQEIDDRSHSSGEIRVHFHEIQVHQSVPGLASLFLICNQLRSTVRLRPNSLHGIPRSLGGTVANIFLEPLFPTAFRIWATKSLFTNGTSHHSSHALTTDQGKFNQKSRTDRIFSHRGHLCASSGFQAGPSNDESKPNGPSNQKVQGYLLDWIISATKQRQLPTVIEN